MSLETKEAPIHRKSFNFGIRKPMECVVDFKTIQEIKNTKRGRLSKNIFYDDIWTNYLINKWVYTYDATFDRNVYFKHILKDKRIYQLIYSGDDLLGDGLYIIYKADLYTQTQSGDSNRKAFYVMPTAYDILKGSFECVDFISEMVADGWIGDEDLALLKQSSAKLSAMLCSMDSDLIDKRKSMKKALNERKRAERQEKKNLP